MRTEFRIALAVGLLSLSLGAWAHAFRCADVLVDFDSCCAMANTPTERPPSDQGGRCALNGCSGVLRPAAPTAGMSSPSSLASVELSGWAAVVRVRSPVWPCGTVNAGWSKGARS